MKLTLCMQYDYSPLVRESSPSSPAWCGMVGSATGRCLLRCPHWATQGVSRPHCCTFQVLVLYLHEDYEFLSLANSWNLRVILPLQGVLFCKGWVSLRLRHYIESCQHLYGCKECFQRLQLPSPEKQHRKLCFLRVVSPAIIFWYQLRSRKGRLMSTLSSKKEQWKCIVLPDMESICMLLWPLMLWMVTFRSSGTPIGLKTIMSNKTVHRKFRSGGSNLS